MTSSSSSSEASTVSPSISSTKLSPSLSQYNFDPLAVHPFTNYVSSNPNNNASTVNYNRSNSSYAYPYRQPHGESPTSHAPMPTSLSPTTIPSHQQSQSSPPKPYAYRPTHPAGIFVPFRQETSSPDLSDILKPKSNSPSDTPPTSTPSKTRPKNMVNFSPGTPSIGLSSSRKH